MDMATVLTLFLLVLLIVVLVLNVLLLQRVAQFDHARIVELLRQELRTSRTDAADSSRAQREELQASFTTLTSSVLTVQGEVRETLTEAGKQTRASLAELSKAFLTLGDNLRTGQAETTKQLNDSLENMRFFGNLRYSRLCLYIIDL